MKDEIKEMNLSEMLFNRDERLLDYIINLEEEKDKYKNVIDKIKEYVNDVIIDETYTNYINELLEEVK